MFCPNAGKRRPKRRKASSQAVGQHSTKTLAPTDSDNESDDSESDEPETEQKQADTTTPAHQNAVPTFRWKLATNGKQYFNQHKAQVESRSLEA
jgi:hypothetical protein